MEEVDTKLSCLRRAGQYQDEKINELLNEKAFTFVATGVAFIVFTGYEWLLWFFPSYHTPWIFTCVAFAFIFIAIYKVTKIREQIKKHRLGSLGEKIVADELEKIKRKGYMVIHDFQHKAVGNIDHIVIGPKGVFVLETKNRTKPDDKSRIFYDGENIFQLDLSNNRTPVKNDKGETPSKQVSRAAAILQKMLSVDHDVKRVNPVVVFPNWKIKLETYGKSPNVRVCNEKTLYKQLVGKDDYFRDYEIIKIYEFLAENNKNN